MVMTIHRSYFSIFKAGGLRASIEGIEMPGMASADILLTKLSSAVQHVNTTCDATDGPRSVPKAPQRLAALHPLPSGVARAGAWSSLGARSKNKGHGRLYPIA